jgi:hypothetical protein
VAAADFISSRIERSDLPMRGVELRLCRPLAGCHTGFETFS